MDRELGDRRSPIEITPRSLRDGARASPSKGTTLRAIIGVNALAFIAGLNVDKVIARIEDLRRRFFLLIVGQLRRDLRDMLALVAGAVELVGARLARTVGFGQCAGAVG